MDPRLLDYYNRELQHVREMGAEFARAYPKIAGRLALEEFECADPYVERLLEGLAFLAARIQLKLDAQYPEFTQHLFEIVYPHYAAPTPSMAVVKLQPNLNEGALAEGVRVPRGTMLRSQIAKSEQTACRYQTAHDVRLWPLEIRKADYFSRDEAMRDVPEVPGVRAGLRLRLAATAGLDASTRSRWIGCRCSCGAPATWRSRSTSNCWPTAWRSWCGRPNRRSLGK